MAQLPRRAEPASAVLCAYLKVATAAGDDVTAARAPCPGFSCSRFGFWPVEAKAIAVAPLRARRRLLEKFPGDGDERMSWPLTSGVFLVEPGGHTVDRCPGTNWVTA